MKIDTRDHYRYADQSPETTIQWAIKWLRFLSPAFWTWRFYRSWRDRRHTGRQGVPWGPGWELVYRSDAGWQWTKKVKWGCKL